MLTGAGYCLAARRAGLLLAAKQAARDYAPWIAGALVLLAGGWFWRRHG